MAYAGPGKEVYTNIVPLTVHSLGGLSIVKELRGSDIPDRVEAIMIVGANTAKTAVRNITTYTGENHSTSLTSGKSPRTPVLQRTDNVSSKGGLIFSKIPEDTSIRFNGQNTAYGIY